MSCPAPSPAAEEWRLRPADAEDEAFLCHSWLKSFRPSATEVPGVIYHRGQHEVIERLLGRSIVTVACNPEDEAQIFGYLVHEKRGPVVVLHYVYVKAPFRRLGLARALLAHVGAEGCHYTHRTPAFARLARALRAHFNPYLGGLL